MPRGITKYSYEEQDLFGLFWSRVSKLENGCWIPKYNNCGWFSWTVDGKVFSKRMSQFAWEILGNGSIEGYQLNKTCSTKNCLNPDHQRKIPRRRAGESTEELFLRKLDRNGEDGCWEYIGRRDNGYGSFYAGVDVGYVGAHRYSWEIHNGKIPEGLWVLHHCDNPPCCNPKHLFLGDHQANVDDRERKGRNKLPEFMQERKDRYSKMYSGGGNPFYGRKHTNESRKRMSKSHIGKDKGRTSPMKGKRHSEKAIEKMKEAQKRRRVFEMEGVK